MKSTLVLLFCMLFFYGCNSNSELTLIPAEFSQNDLSLCELEPCPTISISYLIAEGNREVASKINDEIEQYIVSSLNIGEDSDNVAENMEVAANRFVTIFRNDIEAFDIDVDYEASIEIGEIFENNHLVSLELKSYLYTGGAHGYGAINFKNIDKKTGEELDAEDVFKDLNALKILVETKFREKNNIPKDAPINSTGFWFENDEFYLTTNIGFLEEGIVVLYNVYDIASYADGPKELYISWAEISEQLSNDYFE